MASFSIKRLRKGYVYVLPEADLRAFVGAYPANFGRVTLGAVSMTEDRAIKKWAKTKSWSGTHLGVISGQRNNTGWRFELALMAVRDSTLGEEHDAIKALILKDLEAWVQAKLALPDTAPRTGHKLFVEINHDRFSGVLESTSFAPAGYR